MGKLLTGQPSVSEDEFCSMELVPVLQVLWIITHSLRGITCICWDRSYRARELDTMIMRIMEIWIDVFLCMLFDWCWCPSVLLHQFKKTRDGKNFVQVGNKIGLVLTCICGCFDFTDGRKKKSRFLDNTRICGLSPNCYPEDKGIILKVCLCFSKKGVLFTCMKTWLYVKTIIICLVFNVVCTVHHPTICM